MLQYEKHAIERRADDERLIVNEKNRPSGMKKV